MYIYIYNIYIILSTTLNLVPKILFIEFGPPKFFPKTFMNHTNVCTPCLIPKYDTYLITNTATFHEHTF